MANLLDILPSSIGFMPHGHCFLWKPALLWAHAFSDAVIGITYIGIGVIFFALTRKVRIPFTALIVFIGVLFVTCGCTHLLEVWTVWVPEYWASGAVKVITAFLSVMTGIWLFLARGRVLSVFQATKLAERRQFNLEILARDLESAVREKSEEFKTIFEQSGVGSGLVDASTGKFTRVNRQLCEITGYPEHELLGRHSQEIFPVEGEAITWESLIRSKQGDQKWVQVTRAWVKDSRGERLRAILSVSDLSEQKQVQEKLEQAIQARDNFLSVASHELKTPLTSLQLQTQTFRRAFIRNDTAFLTSDRMSKLADSSERQVERLIRLVDDMLDVARIETGKLELVLEPVDLAQLIHETIERFAPSIAASGCTVSAECESGLVGNWDRYRIEQVVVNLLTNAMKYGAGRPIHIRAEKGGSNGTALFSISDEGQGIAPEKQELIFERFERAVASNAISGLGLGLFIVRSIVTQHRGRVWVDSQMGRGSSFHVELPLFSSEAQPA